MTPENKDKANKLREEMFMSGADRLIKELADLPDEALLSSVARHVKIKVKLF